MVHLKRIALAMAAVAVFPAWHAGAADYDPPIYVEPAEEYVPVEIGSGWYLRGDVAYNFARSYKDRSISFDESLISNEFLGLGTIGAFDIFSYSEKENPVSGSVGFGYHFNDYLRADVNIGILASDKYSGSAQLNAGYLNPFGVVDSLNPDVLAVPDFGCLGARTVTTTAVTTVIDDDGNPVELPPVVNSTTEPDWRRDCVVDAKVKNSAWNGLANAYIDLGTYSGFTPYVGAGIGMLYTRTKVSSSATCEASDVSDTTTVGNTTTTTDTTFLCRGQGNTTDRPVEYEPGSYSESNYNFMYALSAGVSYQLTKNTSIDVGYQYIDAPNIEYYAISDDAIERRKGISSNQIKVGLRYDLW